MSASHHGTIQIFPPIGIARVGNAPDAFYVGPEVYRGLPTHPDGTTITPVDLRDEAGRLCRQAARFRLFRLTEGGPEEITLSTPGVVSITWTVHVANKKSSWYEFQTNKGEHGYASNHPLRNPHAANRHHLVIDPGPRTIVGSVEQSPGERLALRVPFSQDTVPADYRGAHFPPPLYGPGDETPTRTIDTLGELRLDGEGRLLFLGGLGLAGSTDPKPTITQYANNDGWFDDTSDGPVTALVAFEDGHTISAGFALAMVAPPAYAPEIPNLVTLWDTIFDKTVLAGQVPAINAGGIWRRGRHGYKPNFRTEIGPLLERGGLYPWVTAIPPRAHRYDQARLGVVPDHDGPDENRGLREWIFGVLRPPGEENTLVNKGGRTMMPYLAGDNALKPATLTSNYLRLTDTQYFFLEQWMNGWFVNEEETQPAPQAITRGVLENCVGGAFSPGIEMTWISRNPDIYQPNDPFRLRSVMPENGPLGLRFHPHAMQPGDVCRYMAVPWQADFNECSSQPIGDRILWWWPSQRPEFVYVPAQTEADQRRAGPEGLLQVPWVGTDFDQNRDDYISFGHDDLMVEHWWRLGFVIGEARVGGGTRYVEVARNPPRPDRLPPDGDPA